MTPLAVGLGADFVEASPVGQALVGLDRCIVWVNAAFAEVVGRSADSLVGTSITAMHDPAGPPPDLAAADEVIAGTRDRHRARRLLLRPDGRSVPVQLEVSAVRVDGVATAYAVAITDLTELAAAEAALRDERERTHARLTAVVAASHDYVYVRDVVGNRITFQADNGIAGYDSAWHRGLDTEHRYDLAHPGERSRLEQADAEVLRLADGEQVDVRFRFRSVDGTWHWMRRSTTPFSRNPATGEVIEVLGVVRDITDIVENEERLRRAATHDMLTGLANRALLGERLDAALARTGRDDGAVGVVFCDLDGFKSVNDAAGHMAGDAVLVEVAQRLRHAVRDADVVARLGGDEFVVVVDAPERDRADELVAAVVRRVERSLRTPVEVGGIPHTVRASVGYAVAPRDGTRATELLAAADAAMYRAKRAGGPA